MIYFFSLFLWDETIDDYLNVFHLEIINYNTEYLLFDLINNFNTIIQWELSH